MKRFNVDLFFSVAVIITLLASVIIVSLAYKKGSAKVTCEEVGFVEEVHCALNQCRVQLNNGKRVTTNVVPLENDLIVECSREGHGPVGFRIKEI